MFNDCQIHPEDPVLGIAALFNKDENPRKINLGIGVYRDGQGESHVFTVVKKALSDIVNDPKCSLEYLPIEGLAALKDGSQKLLFGCSSEKITSLQSISGTGALYLAGRILSSFGKSKTLYLSDPSYSNHVGIFKKAGFNLAYYRYWNPKTRLLDFEGLLEDLKNAPEGSLVLLHGCAHNPTGCDPSEEQWLEILKVLKSRRLYPIVDVAYQGFASGDVFKDSFATRSLFSGGFEFLVCQSFAKSFGIYGMRTGMLHVVCESENEAKKINSELKQIVRSVYSSPPVLGAKVVARILNNFELFEEWKAELSGVYERIETVRQKLLKGLEEKKTPGNWSHLGLQTGMFSFTGLTEAQCRFLTDEKSIYLLKNGRICVAVLNDKNLNYFIESLDEAVRKV